jgi:hypothetical protein
LKTYPILFCYFDDTSSAPAWSPGRAQENNMPTVNKVRRERASDGSHEHIEGVCATDGTHHTRSQVVASIKAGNRWVTIGGGVIRPINYCPASRCLASPYITTRADDSIDNNLENLPRC